MKKSILITEENESLCKELKKRLLSYEIEMIESSNKLNFVQLFQSRKPDLIIMGSSQESDKDGLETAVNIRRQDSNIPLIFIAGNSSEEKAIAALKAGFNDYFKLPFSYEDLIESVRRNLFYFSEQSRVKSKIISNSSKDPPMIGDSIVMRNIRADLIKIAATDSAVLITGETGTGKEVAAKFIHRNSSRRDKPLVCINCASLPENLIESELFGYERGAFTGAATLTRGKFELAMGGIVMLDEIGDMSPYAQAKILRIIEQKEIYRLGGKKSIALDVRIIAVTNKKLDQLSAEGGFRDDLYYRLNVSSVHLPPLRNRKEDIPCLIEYYLGDLNRRFGRKVKGLTEEALELLLCHNWAGNIRELTNLLEAVFVNLPSGKIDFIDLPTTVRKRLGKIKDVPKKERDHVLAALFATNWNKSKAAKKLQWSRMTLYRKIAKYNIADSRHLKV